MHSFNLRKTSWLKYLAIADISQQNIPYVFVLFHEKQSKCILIQLTETFLRNVADKASASSLVSI